MIFLNDELDGYISLIPSYIYIYMSFIYVVGYHIYILCIRTYMCVRIYINIYTYRIICMYKYIYIRIYVCMYTHCIYIYIKHPNIPRFGKDSANVWNHQKFQLFLSLPCVHRNEPRPCNTLWDRHEGTNPYLGLLWILGGVEDFSYLTWEGLL